MPGNIRWGTVLLLAVLALLGLSFEAGRRYPFEFLNRLRPRQPVVAAPAFWSLVSTVPQTHFESSAAVWRDRLYVFGGFWNASLEASARVDIWDPESGKWSRAADMPHPTTHRNALPVGDTIWFAGGFEGDHPGPVTDRVLGYVPATDVWFEGPPLPFVRGAGALVADGRRLHYFGGYGGDKLPRAEHWMLDLDAWQAGEASWEPRAPLPTARGQFTGASLDGYLYAIGGAEPHDPFSADLIEVHRYDPQADTWSDAASLPFPLSHNEPATIVRDGQIWLVGGRSKGRSTASWNVMIYDASSDLWMPWKSLPRPLLAPAAGAIGDELFVAGGADMEINPEPVTGVWRASMKPGWWGGMAMPEPAGEVAAGVVGTRMVVVGEGTSSTQLYDVSGGYWIEEISFSTAPRPLVGRGHAAEVVGDSLYLLGGIGAGAGQMQIYDVRSNRWTVGPELPFQAGGSASALIDGKLYVGGGIDGSSTLAEAAAYDPATQTWSAIAPMPKPTSHAASGTDGARWYVFGGRGPRSADAVGAANGLDDVQVYDPATDTWTVSGSGPDAPAPLPVGRGGMGKALFVVGRFYVIGGEMAGGPGADEHGVYDRVDIYDVETNVWAEGPPLSTARHGIFPVLVGSRRILVAGGRDRTDASRTDVLEILDVTR
jgi:N-acetylneuraminic acid mutarotase